MKKTLILLAIFVFILNSCAKYEEGPVVSFRGKATRLSGLWEIEETIGIDTVFNKNGSGIFEIFKDGDFTFYDKLIFDGSEISLDYHGTWEWTSTKEGIILYLPRYSDTLSDYSLTITKLGMEVLWFQNDQEIVFKCIKSD